MHDIDIIIPTYNCSMYVCRAIDSVLAQTLPAKRIYVIDDGSTDNTKQLLKNRYRNNKKVIYHYQKNKGLSATRNTGIKLSKSPYIAFLDSDDTWEPTKLEKQIEVFKQSVYNNTGLVYCGYDLIDENGKTLHTHSYSLDTNVCGDVYNILSKRNQIAGSGSAVLIKKECFEKVGLFDESLTAAEDWDMWLRIAKQYEIDYVKDNLVHIRRHSQNMQTNFQNIFINTIKVYQKHQIETAIDARGLNNLHSLLIKSVVHNGFNIELDHQLIDTMNQKMKDTLFSNKTMLFKNIVNYFATFVSKKLNI